MYCCSKLLGNTTPVGVTTSFRAMLTTIKAKLAVIGDSSTNSVSRAVRKASVKLTRVRKKIMGQKQAFKQSLLSADGAFTAQGRQAASLALIAECVPLMQAAQHAYTKRCSMHAKLALCVVKIRAFGMLVSPALALRRSRAAMRRAARKARALARIQAAAAKAEARKVAATKIQTWWRTLGVQARWQIARSGIQRKLQRKKCATRIQAMARGVAARRRVAALQRALQQQHEAAQLQAQLQAAVVIQKHVRGWEARLLAATLRQLHAKRMRAATKVFGRGRCYYMRALHSG